jgi:hypothetical protein
MQKSGEKKLENFEFFKNRAAPMGAMKNGWSKFSE